MKAKVLHYAADRDDKIVATYKEVTFIGKHVSWYVEDKDEKHEGRDNIAIVERVDGICFVAEFLSRNAAFDKEHLAAVEDEARNLRAAMQKRIAQKQWIPLTYVAAYEALGWDARPLKEHRDQIRRLREAADRERKLAQAERGRSSARKRLFDAAGSSRRNTSSACAANMGSKSTPGRSGPYEPESKSCPEPKSYAGAATVEHACPRWTVAAG